MEKEHDEEIDLLDLTVKAIRFVRKHFLFILISSLIGISISLLYRFLSPAVYEGRMVLSSDILTEPYSKAIATGVKNLIYEKNYSSLGTLLGLSEEEARGVKTFDIDFEKTDKEKALNIEPAIFTVGVTTRKKEVLPKLQNGIVRLLQNNEFVAIRVRQRRALYQSIIEKIGSEINSLDSLKKNLFFGVNRPKSSETLFVDPSNIYTQLIQLHKERLDYKNSLELSESVQLIEGFIVSKKPPQTRLLTLLSMGLLGGIGIALASLIFSPLYKLANKTSN